MVRDLLENAIALVQRKAETRFTAEIDAAVEERLVDTPLSAPGGHGRRPGPPCALGAQP